MTVARILAGKARVPVIIEGGATLLHAAQRMTAHKIGSLLILGANDKLTGIFTERDYLRVTSFGGEHALKQSVCEHMTRAVKTCSRSSTIAAVEAAMSEGKFRHMPVVENDKVIGIVSQGDIAKHRVVAAETEAEKLRDY